MLSKQFEDFVKKNQLLRRDASYLVALSGGADSVALLLLMLHAGYQVEAAHCNFHLRGQESDNDERFVEQLCREHDVKLHKAHFDTRTYAELHRVSIEMAARELRYRYFEQLIQDVGAESICVAHHRDDSVETILLNLIRGTGIHGLHGILPRNGHVIRPLLCFTRADIENYLRQQGQTFVTDSTNLMFDADRNKIRLQVVPLLRNINPAVCANIIHTAENIRQAEMLYQYGLDSIKNKAVSTDGHTMSIRTDELQCEAVLYEILKDYGFNSIQVKQIYEHRNLHSGRVYETSEYELLVNRGCLLVERRAKPFAPLLIPECGTYRINDRQLLSIEQKVVDANFNIPREEMCVCVDAEGVLFPLRLRTIKTGDRLTPLGMKGTKLLSDLMTDAKLTLFEKRRQLVLTDARDQIIWVVGLRIENSFRVTASTTSYCLFTIKASSV